VQEIPRIGHVTSLAFHQQFFVACGKDSKVSVFRNMEHCQRWFSLESALVDKCQGPTKVNNAIVSDSDTSKYKSLNLLPRCWIHPEPLRFLEISEKFLEKSSLNSASTMSTISFLTAVRMLRHYLQRIRILEDDGNEIVLSLKDEFDYITVICQILQSLIDGMEWNFNRKFNISAKDTRRIQVWNVKWRRTRIVSIYSDFVPFSII